MDHLPVRLDGFSSVEASTRFKFFAREVLYLTRTI